MSRRSTCSRGGLLPCLASQIAESQKEGTFTERNPTRSLAIRLDSNQMGERVEPYSYNLMVEARLHDNYRDKVMNKSIPIRMVVEAEPVASRCEVPPTVQLPGLGALTMGNLHGETFNLRFLANDLDGMPIQRSFADQFAAVLYMDDAIHDDMHVHPRPNPSP